MADTYRDYSEMNTALCRTEHSFPILIFVFSFDSILLCILTYEIQRDHSNLPYVETQFFEQIGDEHFNRVSIREGKFPETK